MAEENLAQLALEHLQVTIDEARDHVVVLENWYQGTYHQGTLKDLTRDRKATNGEISREGGENDGPNQDKRGGGAVGRGH
ncbi:MAG: hypothetical protein WKF67_00565, partial [Rubrobacteraceae bacterium]